MTEHLNADFNLRVHLRTSEMDWQPSPAPGVERKRLELSGPVEQGRVTSIVRYAPGSRFPSHEHPDGEEILVLDGIFEDETGAYPAGTFLLNPEGFSHAPASTEGCTLFVKLRQYPGRERPRVCINTRTSLFTAADTAGVRQLVLYRQRGHPELIRLVRLAPGTTTGRHLHAGGEELLVLEGALEDEQGRYGAGDWLRSPPGSRHSLRSAEGCLFYVKTGHLALPATARIGS